MRRIPLHGKHGLGKFVLVDDRDYEKLSQYKWRMTTLGYVVRTHYVRPKINVIWMHREIMETPKGLETDHIDHNRLNNQRSNLRIATHQQNNYNKGPQTNNTSGHKGISWRKAIKRWDVQVNGQYIGVYITLDEAVIAQKQAQARLQGEFAHVS